MDNKKYRLTVGLEVHAELKTKTKMFCDCINNPDEERPNINICPVCLGYPGTLPVINKEAVRQVLRFGVSVGGEVADYTEFDRKNYFYPDIPKGYQISQYKFPLVKGGQLAGVLLTRVHLEEDTAKSSHTDKNFSLIDFNRSGIPLMELVTEPVIHSAEEAGNFARELQLILWYLEASGANMEKGEMRVEANISVSTDDSFGLNQSEGPIGRTGVPVLGTKVEVKNLNSFKAVEKAIKFEYQRHTELLERGEKVLQETRGWDENKEVTFSQRAKEDSHDYRYFPDPDLPKLFISEIKDFDVKKLKKSLPSLPSEKRHELKERGIGEEASEVIISNLDTLKLYTNYVVPLPRSSSVLGANYIINDVQGTVSARAMSIEDIKLNPTTFAEVIEMNKKNELSSRGTKDILKILIVNGGNAKQIAEEKGLLQKNDTEEIKNIVLEVINKNEKAVKEYRAGNSNSLQYLIGQGMKESKGSANPQILKELFQKLLK